MKEMLDDLQKRLADELDNLRAAREAKEEMQKRFGVIMAEKDSMKEIMRKAEKKAEEFKRELDLAKAAQKVQLDSNEKKNKQLDDFQTIITD